MLNRTDKSMLSALVLVTLSSTGGHYYQQQKETSAPLRDMEVVSPAVSTAPDFHGYATVGEKKDAFFSFMIPLIEKENSRILANRERIIALSGRTFLSEEDRQYLLSVSKRYDSEPEGELDVGFYERLLARVDIIPPSLALAQSANESAWGTSRFAREGNNYFGQWCFREGCGIVPGSRPAGENYEVRQFTNPGRSVRSYMHNLNTHYQYQKLRDLRVRRRLNDQVITGPELAQGLYGYSIRGGEYINELVSMIATNDLLRYDHDSEYSPES